MAGVTKKSFEAPDETRTPDKTEVRVVDLGGLKAARITFQPGWNVILAAFRPPRSTTLTSVLSGVRVSSGESKLFFVTPAMLRLAFSALLATLVRPVRSVRRVG